jgi:hypothetical protein
MSHLKVLLHRSTGTLTKITRCSYEVTWWYYWSFIPVHLQLRGCHCRPHNCILTTYWEGSLFKYCPWAFMHLAQLCWHYWKHFWNSCCGIVFNAVATYFWKSSTSWNLRSFKDALYFLKQPRVIRKHQSNRVDVPSIFGSEIAWQRAPCELKHSHCGESNRWAKFQAFSMHSYT